VNLPTCNFVKSGDFHFWSWCRCRIENIRTHTHYIYMYIFISRNVKLSLVPCGIKSEMTVNYKKFESNRGECDVLW